MKWVFQHWWNSDLTHWSLNNFFHCAKNKNLNNISWLKSLTFEFKFYLEWVTEGHMVDEPALIQAIAWNLSGTKPLHEPMLTKTHGATGPQWVNNQRALWCFCMFDIILISVLIPICLQCAWVHACHLSFAVFFTGMPWCLCCFYNN